MKSKITILNKSITIECNSYSLHTFIHESSFFKKLLPQVNISSVSKDAPNIQLIEGDIRRISMNQDKLEIYTNPNEIKNEQIAYLSQYFLQGELAKNSQYLFHAGAFALSSKDAVLIIGSEGNGKSTLVAAYAYNHNLPIYGDDYILTELSNKNQNILLGNEELSLRVSALEQEFIHNLVKGVYPTNLPEVKDKVICDLEGIIAHTNDPHNISNIFFIEADDTPLIVRELDKYDAKLYLYEASSKVIRGVGMAISCFNFPFKSLDSNSFSKERLRALDSLVSKTPVIRLRGIVSDMYKYLCDNLGEYETK